ncbi:hypothetical protein VNO77_05350 [Canavalia gladiata]|uniref:Uncharacterized protein n=1 Tax=Canavalia gladiata TaxID=3824 RepID=A0AAN9N3D9_CANGL
MATSISSYQNKSTQKPIPLSQSEIKAAKQLIQLSSGDSEEDQHSSSNSCSYNMVQGKPHHTKVNSGGDVSSVAATTVESEDESFSSTNKRYRYIKDLYSVTVPMSTVKVKKKSKK